MAAYSSKRRGTSPAKTALLIVLFLLFGGGGTAVALVAAGIVQSPWARPREPSHEGEVLVPLSGRTIPAYSRIMREDLMADIQHIVLASRWIAKKDLPPETITDVSQIIGRVMRREKGPSYSFTENDFLPRGTRPGLVAGIPPGKRSLTIEASKIPGLHGLLLGDRFDVIATMPMEKNHNTSGKGPPPMKEPEVRVLVNNGALISPIRMRAAPTTTNSLMNGQRTSTKPVEEVVIAIDPDEIAELTAAMSLEAAITCVARSGNPEDTAESITPGLPPAPPPTTIEAVRGDKSETLYFPVEPTEEQHDTDESSSAYARFKHVPRQRTPIASNDDRK